MVFRTAYFVWVRWNDIIAPPIRGKLGKGRMVGLCSETKRVAKLTTEPIVVLVVANTYIEKDADGNEVCEEGTRCHDLSCHLNKTTWQSLSHAMGCKRIPKQPENFTPGKGLNGLDFSEIPVWDRGTSCIAELIPSVGG